jgi:anti-anti-sigma factor
VHAERIPRDDAVYLRLSGIVTDECTSDFDESLIDRSDYGRHVMLSLRDVILLNSSGIGMLLKLNRNIAQQGGKMVLLDVPANVRQVLQFMKLGNILPIAESEQKAREMLQ